jgi:hypothetical protein
VGNYFKTCWFLGKEGVSEKAEISYEKLFKFKQKEQEIVN